MLPSDTWHTRQQLLLRHIRAHLEAAGLTIGSPGLAILAGYLGTPGEPVTGLVLVHGPGQGVKLSEARRALRTCTRWCIHSGRVLHYLAIHEAWADPYAQAEAAWHNARNALDDLLLSLDAVPRPLSGYDDACWADALAQAGTAEDRAWQIFAAYLPPYTGPRYLEDKELVICPTVPTNGHRAERPAIPALAGAPPTPTRPTDLPARQNRKLRGGRPSQ